MLAGNNMEKLKSYMIELGYSESCIEEVVNVGKEMITELESEEVLWKQ